MNESKEFAFTEAMGNIDVFAERDTEQRCRDALREGVLWLRANEHRHAEIHPRRGWSEDAKTLASVTGCYVGNASSVAMPRVVAAHCMYVHDHGWSAFAQQMEQRLVRKCSAAEEAL